MARRWLGGWGGGEIPRWGSIQSRAVTEDVG